jgi:hypothetical protein
MLGLGKKFCIMVPRLVKPSSDLLLVIPRFDLRLLLRINVSAFVYDILGRPPYDLPPQPCII